MLTIKQMIDNTYIIAQVMQSNTNVKRAASIINNVCDLNVNESDLIKLIQLRVNHSNIDKLFIVWE